jgi:nucleoside-diphosphate-sugar epimerase
MPAAHPERSFSGAQVLITGGLGFIGSHLARGLLAQGALVTVMDSLIPEYGGNLFNVHDIADRIIIDTSDVRDRAAIAALVPGKDFIFNLAGQTSHLDSMSDPHTDLAINADAQLSVLEAARHHSPQARIVFASTRQLYGKPHYLPVDEKHPVAPVDVNGINKLAGEWYHILYQQVYGLPTSVLRLTNTYGPAMRVKDARQTFLGIWIKNALTNEPIQIFGSGEQKRDFNYVDDCVTALEIAATNPQAEGRVFNLGSDEVVSLQALAQLITDIEPQSQYELIPFPPDRAKIDIGDYFADTSLIRSELGWEPQVDLRDGLTRTLDYYRQFGRHYWTEGE